MATGIAMAMAMAMVVAMAVAMGRGRGHGHGRAHGRGHGHCRDHGRHVQGHGHASQWLQLIPSNCLGTLELSQNPFKNIPTKKLIILHQYEGEL